MVSVDRYCANISLKKSGMNIKTKKMQVGFHSKLVFYLGVKTPTLASEFMLVVKTLTLNSVNSSIPSLNTTTKSRSMQAT